MLHTVCNTLYKYCIFKSWFRILAVFSTPIIVFYQTVETIYCFAFERKIYNWPFNRVFRILVLIHDFGYFVSLSGVPVSFMFFLETQVYLIHFTINSWNTGTPSYCAIYSIEGLHWIDITCTVLFFATFCVGIGVSIMYTRFPEKFCNGDEPEEPDELCVTYTRPSCEYSCSLAAALKWKPRKKLLFGLKIVNFLIYAVLIALGAYDTALGQIGNAHLIRESNLTHLNSTVFSRTRRQN